MVDAVLRDSPTVGYLLQSLKQVRRIALACSGACAVHVCAHAFSGSSRSKAACALQQLLSDEWRALMRAAPCARRAAAALAGASST